MEFFKFLKRKESEKEILFNGIILFRTAYSIFKKGKVEESKKILNDSLTTFSKGHNKILCGEIVQLLEMFEKKESHENLEKKFHHIDGLKDDLRDFDIGDDDEDFNDDNS